MHIHKIVYIKTFKIAPTCFDPKIIFRELHCSSLKYCVNVTPLRVRLTMCVRHIATLTVSGVPFTQYDMLPQHQSNIRS